jgi:hypothetical protein
MGAGALAASVFPGLTGDGANLIPKAHSLTNLTNFRNQRTIEA